MYIAKYEFELKYLSFINDVQKEVLPKYLKILLDTDLKIIL